MWKVAISPSTTSTTVFYDAALEMDAQHLSTFNFRYSNLKRFSHSLKTCVCARTSLKNICPWKVSQ